MCNSSIRLDWLDRGIMKIHDWKELHQQYQKVVVLKVKVMDTEVDASIGDII